MKWTGRYVGRPFGEGAGEVTCWALLRAVYAEQLGVDLPAYGEIGAADLLRVARAMERDKDSDPWREVVEPRAFDVAVMRRRKVAGHVGVMVDPNRVLHVERATSACIEDVRDWSIRHRLIGFRRHATQ